MWLVGVVVVMYYRLARAMVRQSMAKRAPAPKLLLSSLALARLEAELFSPPSEWVAEAERAVDAERAVGNRGTNLQSQVRMDREYYGARRQETVQGWMPQHFPWLYVSTPNATRKVTHGNGDALEG